MNNREIDKFIADLNESVRFAGKSSMILSVKRTKDCEPRTVKLERYFKFGKVTFKRCDSDSESRV